MAHRSIILELTKQKTAILTDHVEQDRLVALSFHDAMRDVVLQRGSTILYCALINMEGADNGG